LSNAAETAPQGAAIASRPSPLARPLSRNVAIAALAALFGAFILFFWPAMERAVEVWSGSRSFNHGFLVIPVSLYLVWDRRETLRGLAPEPFLWALPGVFLGALAWLVAYAVAVYEGQQMAIIVTVQFVLLAVLGVRIYRRLLFPFLFLFFLVPTGEFLVPYLQDFTTRFTVLALQLTGIPVFSDGVFISIPGADFHVAEACAGLRFLVATIAFGLLFGDLAYTKLWKRAVFAAACVIVPVIANGFRAYGIVMIAWWTGADAAGLVDHIVYGWVFFSMVTLALMAVGWMFRDSDARPMPRGFERRSSRAGPLKVAGVAAAALALVAAPRAYAAYAERAPAGTAAALEAPAASAPWLPVTNPAAAEWGPAFPRADGTILQSYAAGGRTFDLFLAYYRNQTSEKRLVAYENQLAEERWDMVSRSTEILSFGGEDVPVAVTRLRAGRSARVLYAVYWADRHFAASPLKVKLLQARASFIDRTPEAAFIAFSTEVRDIGEDPTLALRDLLAHLEPPQRQLARLAGQ
jgi:exosortase A